MGSAREELEGRRATTVVKEVVGANDDRAEELVEYVKPSRARAMMRLSKYLGLPKTSLRKINATATTLKKNIKNIFKFKGCKQVDVSEYWRSNNAAAEMITTMKSASTRLLSASKMKSRYYKCRIKKVKRSTTVGVERLIFCIRSRPTLSVTTKMAANKKIHRIVFRIRRPVKVVVLKLRRKIKKRGAERSLGSNISNQDRGINGILKEPVVDDEPSSEPLAAADDEEEAEQPQRQPKPHPRHSEEKDTEQDHQQEEEYLKKDAMLMYDCLAYEIARSFAEDIFSDENLSACSIM